MLYWKSVGKGISEIHLTHVFSWHLSHILRNAFYKNFCEIHRNTHSSLDPATMQKRIPSWVLSCLFYEVFQNSSISPVQTTTACAEDRNMIFLPMDFLLNRSINKNLVQLELSTGSLTLPQSCLCSCFWNQPSVWI